MLENFPFIKPTNSSISVRNFLFSILLGVGVLAVIVATAFQTFRLSPQFGDIATWLFVLEWMDRGQTLYNGVWEHKDWGYFTILRIPYEIAAIHGVYIAGILFALVFGFGVYLVVRNWVNARPATTIAALATVAYVFSPSYFGIYIENFAIALITLALGLLARYPTLAGGLFALAVSVKLGSIIPFIVVYLALLAMIFIRRPIQWETLRKLLYLVSLGFIATALLILLTAHRQENLLGWIEVVNYNRFYSSFRLNSMPSLNEDIGTYLLGFIYMSGTEIFTFIISCFIGIIIMCLIFAHLRPPNRTAAKNSLSNHQMLTVVMASTLGCALVLGTQVPPALQHYQFLVGGLLTLLASLFAYAWSSWSKFRWEVLRAHAFSGVLLPVVVGILLLVTSRGIEKSLDLPGNWRNIGTLSAASPAVARIPQDSNIAFVGTGGKFLSLKGLDKSISLACRHSFAFPHIVPVYGDEILKCLHSGPDYLVRPNEPNEYRDEAFDNETLAIIDKQYRYCTNLGDTFELWALNTIPCWLAEAT